MAAALGVKNRALLREAVRRARGGEQAKTKEDMEKDGVLDRMEDDAWGPISPNDK